MRLLELNKFHFNHSPNIVNVEPVLSTGSLFERGWSMVMYEKGCIEGHTQSYVKLINAYCKKTGQEICSDTVNKYLAKYTKEEFENKLREFYDLPKTITPASILKAKDKVHELSEHEHQCKVVKWCRDNKITVFSVPNGFISGSSSPTYMSYMRAEGLLPGACDLVVLPGNGVTVFMEMKKEKGGVLSDAQKKFRDFLLGNGYCYCLAKGANEAIEFIKEKLNG